MFANSGRSGGLASFASFFLERDGLRLLTSLILYASAVSLGFVLQFWFGVGENIASLTVILFVAVGTPVLPLVLFRLRIAEFARWQTQFQGSLVRTVVPANTTQDEKYLLRPLPYDDVYFWVKRIDNFGLQVKSVPLLLNPIRS